MRKTIVSAALGLLCSVAQAQIDTGSIKAGWANLDYAVPESPAFKMLGATPDNILQPTSVRSIAINVGNYYLTNGTTIPKNLAVEIAPLMLNQKASLNDFNQKAFLYRMRFSLGTTVAGNGAYNIAEGLRFTIIDRTDLRTNHEALNYFYGIAERMSRNTDQALLNYMAAHPGTCATTIECRERFNTDSNFRHAVLAELKPNLDSITNFRDRMRQRLWNAEIMEVGIGAVQSYPDSLLTNNITAYRLGGWLTYANHFSANDQILFGGKFHYVDSMTTSNISASLGTRYYYGSNELRGFVQVEYRYDGSIQSTVGSVGCIFKLINGLWSNFALSFVYDENNKLSYHPSFNISFATPETRKL